LGGPWQGYARTRDLTLPAGVDLGLYRIVEDALHSAGQHQGSAVGVSLRFGNEELELRLTARCHEPTSWPTGAMRERVALCGGQLDSDPGDADGWRFSARMPRGLQGVLAAGWLPRARIGELGWRAEVSVSVPLLIADDQQLIRAGFRMILAVEPDIEVVGEAATGAEAVAMTRELSPDVVLMDIRMPELDGIEATRRILAHNPAQRTSVSRGVAGGGWRDRSDRPFDGRAGRA
jgi:Response regulator receiver domain